MQNPMICPVSDSIEGTPEPDFSTVRNVSVTFGVQELSPAQFFALLGMSSPQGAEGDRSGGVASG